MIFLQIATSSVNVNEHHGGKVQARCTENSDVKTGKHSWFPWHIINNIVTALEQFKLQFKHRDKKHEKTEFLKPSENSHQIG